MPWIWDLCAEELLGVVGEVVREEEMVGPTEVADSRQVVHQVVDSVATIVGNAATSSVSAYTGAALTLRPSKIQK